MKLQKNIKILISEIGQVNYEIQFHKEENIIQYLKNKYCTGEGLKEWQKTKELINLDPDKKSNFLTLRMIAPRTEQRIEIIQHGNYLSYRVNDMISYEV